MLHLYVYYVVYVYFKSAGLNLCIMYRAILCYMRERCTYTLIHSNMSCTISVGVKGEASCSYYDSRRCKFPIRACIVGQVKLGQYALHLYIVSVLILALSIGYS